MVYQPLDIGVHSHGRLHACAVSASVVLDRKLAGLLHLAKLSKFTAMNLGSLLTFHEHFIPTPQGPFAAIGRQHPNFLAPPQIQIRKLH